MIKLVTLKIRYMMFTIVHRKCI